MIHITLKNQKIPALGFGTWQLRGEQCREAVLKALEIGYRHIDTAQIYENEGEVGVAIENSPVKREDVFLTTKVWMTQVRSGDMQKSIDASLRKLRSEYVDLLLIHWPTVNVPFEEQIEALQFIRQEGKAKLIGVSNFTVAQMKQAKEVLGADIVANQVEYHPYLSQAPVLDYIRKHDMFLTAYTPLARGKVSGDPVIESIAKANSKTAGQVTLRWLVQQDRVAAIPKAGSEKHMRENFEIFNFALSDDEMKAISALARPDGRLISPEWAPQWDMAA